VSKQIDNLAFKFPVQWNETLGYFHWKCESNVSDISYEKLQQELAISGVEIHTL